MAYGPEGFYSHLRGLNNCPPDRAFGLSTEETAEFSLAHPDSYGKSKSYAFVVADSNAVSHKVTDAQAVGNRQTDG